MIQQRIHHLMSSEPWLCHMKLYTVPHGWLVDLVLKKRQQKLMLSRERNDGRVNLILHRTASKCKKIYIFIYILCYRDQWWINSSIHLFFCFILTSVINLPWSSSSYYSYSPHAELNSRCTTGAEHKQSNLFHSAEITAAWNSAFFKIFSQ